MIEFTNKSKELKKEADKWQNGALLFDSITGALGAGNIGGTIAQTVQPFVAQQIGEYFKDKGTQGSSGHLLAHAILGAAVAAAGGDNPFVGGLSAAGSEKAAPILTKWLYGKDKKIEDLTAEQKSTITSIVSMIGAGIGTIAGGDSNIKAGADAAQNAADNNQWLYIKNKNGKTPVQFDNRVNSLAEARELYGKDAVFVKNGDVFEDGKDIIELLEGGWYRVNGETTCSISEGKCTGEKPKDIDISSYQKDANGNVKKGIETAKTSASQYSLSQKADLCRQLGCNPFAVDDDYFSMLKNLTPETLEFLKRLPQGDGLGGDPIKGLQNALNTLRMLERDNLAKDEINSVIKQTDWGNQGNTKVIRLTDGRWASVNSDGTYWIHKSGDYATYALGGFFQPGVNIFSNIGNGLLEPFRGAESGILGTNYIPVIPRASWADNSAYWQNNSLGGINNLLFPTEVVGTILVGRTLGRNALASQTGRIFTGFEASYNIGSGLYGVDITQNNREMPWYERALRVGGGILGAGSAVNAEVRATNSLTNRFASSLPNIFGNPPSPPFVLAGTNGLTFGNVSTVSGGGFGTSTSGTSKLPNIFGGSILGQEKGSNVLNMSGEGNSSKSGEGSSSNKTPNPGTKENPLPVTYKAENLSVELPALGKSAYITAKLDNGQTVTVGIVDMTKDGPIYILDKTSKLADGTVVKANISGGGSLTETVLNKTISAYKIANNGAIPPNLPGSLAFENLANFQKEFSILKAANPKLTDTEIGNLAIRKISFGQARINVGYGNISVKVRMENGIPVKVEVNALPSKK